MIPLGPIFQAVGAVVDLIIEAVENFSDSWGGEKVNAGKVILGALTIIGLLADLFDDDWTQKYRLIKSRYFLSVSLGYTHLKQQKTMSIGPFSGFWNMLKCAVILLT